MHYPPFNGYEKLDMNFIKTMKKYNVKTCIYGHIHGEAGKDAKQGKIDVQVHLIMTDSVKQIHSIENFENFIVSP